MVSEALTGDARTGARAWPVRVLRAPFTPRAWSELLYAILGMPLAVASFCLIVVMLGVGGALSITAVGLPMIVAVLALARAVGATRRGMIRGLLGAPVPTPSRAPAGQGVLGRLSVALRDPVSWRSVAYVLVGLPVAAIDFAVAAVCWVYGLLFVASPVLARVEPVRVHHRHHHAMRGAFLTLGDYAFDTAPRMAILVAVGVVLVLAGPWALHGVLAMDRALARALFGTTSTAERIRTLERRRAHAVDDAAAALRRIERDLHDGAQARLIALGMNLSEASEELRVDEQPGDLSRARDLVEAARGNAQRAIVELRDLARGIHPPVLDQGLAPALDTLVATSVVPVRLVVRVPTRPAASIETIAYFCAAELLTNVGRHSGASHASIEVTRQEDRLLLRVTDDGVGGASRERGSGLAGLTERVETVDGTLTLDSPAGGPTVITVDLPTHA